MNIVRINFVTVIYCTSSEQFFYNIFHLHYIKLKIMTKQNLYHKKINYGEIDQYTLTVSVHIRLLNSNKLYSFYICTISNTILFELKV